MSGCSNLQEIIVDAANQKYMSSEGVLYNKEMTILHSYPAGKTNLEFAIPSSVIVISTQAFYYSKILKSVTIHENVASIGWFAFESDIPLTSITVKNVEPIALGEDRFGSNTEAAATLYVPYGSKTKYQQASGWKNFQTIVEMEPETPIKGDLDGDGYTDVTDLVVGIDFILGNRELNETEQYILDMNNDGEVNVGDIILLIKAILNTQGYLSPALARGPQASLDLSGYTALQMTVTVPMGSEVTGMRLVGDNQRTHQLMYQQTSENTYAVVVYSMQNQTFSPVTDGLIVVEGVSEAETSNVLLSTRDCERYWLDSLPQSIMQTGITEIYDGMTNDQPVYDLSGRRVVNDTSAKRKWSKGVYIIDGKKVVGK